MKKELQIAIEASLNAGKAIMDIYNSENFEIESKADKSPLTIADRKTNEVINDFLLPGGIPIISEENQQLPYRERKDWEFCWMVDPLDGTKEFIKRNGEFTVNIALIEKQRPIAEVILAPAIQSLYFGDVIKGRAYKAILKGGNENFLGVLEQAIEIKPSVSESVIKVVGSRSHLNEDTFEFIEI